MVTRGNPPPTPFSVAALLYASRAAQQKVKELGLPAVIAYGLTDAVTYTAAFVLAFLSYEKTTGINPTTDLKAVVSIMVLMWAGNNVTRPARVAGAIAASPLVKRAASWLQMRTRAQSVNVGYGLIVAVAAGLAFLVAGLLIASRLVMA